MLLKEKARTLLLEDILVVSGLPPWSDAAVHYALGLARRHQARTHFAHATLTCFGANNGRFRWPEAMSLSTSSEMGEFVVPPKLRMLLEREEFDLVIVSCEQSANPTRPRNRMVRELLKTTDRPMLILGPGVPRRELLWTKIGKILYATDFSPQALAAAQHAFSWAQEHRAALVMLHIVEELGQASDCERQRLEEPFRKWMGELVPEELPLWCDLDQQVEFGNAGATIVSAALQQQPDLIVIGVSGFDGVDPSSLGQTAAQIIRRSPCPVLVVRDYMVKPVQVMRWVRQSRSAMAVAA